MENINGKKITEKDKWKLDIMERYKTQTMRKR